MTPQICTNIRIDSNTLGHNPINSYFQNKIVKKKKKKKNYCLAHLKLAAAVKSAIEARWPKKMGLKKHSAAVKRVAEEKEIFPLWRTRLLNSFMLEDKIARVSHCHNDDGWEMRMRTIRSIKVLKARFSSRSGELTKLTKVHGREVW